MAEDESTEMTPEEMRAYIKEAPPPPPHRGRLRRRLRPDPPGPWDLADKDEGYDLSGRGLAHAFLILAEERPELLEVPESADGWEAASNERLWEAFKERWPRGDEWLGGVTGFQFGWAHNAVRYALGAPPVGNPAIMTVGV